MTRRPTEMIKTSIKSYFHDMNIRKKTHPKGLDNYKNNPGIL